MNSTVTPVVPVLLHDGATNRCGTFTHEDDRPPVIVVGSLASIDHVHALANRHGLDACTLLAFARQGAPS